MKWSLNCFKKTVQFKLQIQRDSFYCYSGFCAKYFCVRVPQEAMGASNKIDQEYSWNRK
jgi:hypothetical protein